jgi:hypothetical protein
MGLEGTLHANTVGDFTNSERRTETTIANADYDAFESLKTFFVAFLDTHLHDNCVAGAEAWNVSLQLGLFYQLYDLVVAAHCVTPPIINCSLDTAWSVVTVTVIAR